MLLHNIAAFLPKTSSHQNNETPGQPCKERRETLSKSFAKLIRNINLWRNKSLGGGRRSQKEKLLSPRRSHKPSQRMEQIRNQAITKDGINMLSHRVNLNNYQAIAKDGASRSKALQKLTDNRLITSFGHAIAKIP